MAPAAGRQCPDVLVAGAGPAGLAAALALRRHGLSVTTVDRAGPACDKACGEGILPAGVAALRRLGVELPGAGRSHPLRGICYLDGPLRLEGSFPGPPGLGIRRTDLHAALATAAAAAGVHLHWHAPLESATGTVLTAGGLSFAARYMVAADGLHSPIRSRLGLDGRSVRRRRYGIRRHYAMPPWTDHVEVHWGDGAEAYVTPVGHGLVGVALLWGAGGEGFDALLRRFPALAARLAGAPAASRDRGAGPLGQRARRVVRGRWLLLGDAAGSVDPITGEGLSLAFRHAEALARALARDRPGEYARAHRRMAAGPRLDAGVVLALARRPRLRRRVLAALAGEPALFRRLLARAAGSGDGPRPRDLWRLGRLLAAPRAELT